MRKGRTIKYAARLLLVAVIGVTLLGSLPAPVQAQEEDLELIDLVLDGEGATSWSIDNILPCDSGIKTVTLHNAGSEDGFVTIWVSDIVSDEGLNPEPETDTEGEGELDDHLLLGLSSSNGLSTNLSLPTTINNFPQSASDSNYIRINPLNSGDTVTLVWEWELPCETGNDAQGDTVSFTINYLLEELPPPPVVRPSGGGGFGGVSCSEILTVDFLGEITKGSMTRSGRLCDDLEASCPDDIHLLEIEEGTQVLNAEGEVVTLVEIGEAEAPTLPANTVVVGNAYDFRGYTDDSACCSVIFDEPVMLTLGYRIDDLPDDVLSVALFYYAPGIGWIKVEAKGDVVAEVGRLTAQLEHLSIFAILAEVPPPAPTPPPPAPASFELSNLQITPSQFEIWQTVTFVIKIGEEVTISADVTNRGGQEGSYTAILKINGETEGTQEITLRPGQSEQVVFTVSDNGPGQYVVTIDSLSGEFTSSLWINWWLIGGIIAALILLGWLGWYLRKRLS